MSDLYRVLPSVSLDERPGAVADAGGRAVGDGGCTTGPSVPPVESVPVHDGAAVRRLRSELAGLRAELAVLWLAAPASSPGHARALVVHGLLPCTVDVPAYVAAFGAFCLHVLRLPVMPSVSCVKFFDTAGRGPGAVLHLSCALAAGSVMSAKRRLLHSSCGVSIDWSRAAAERLRRAAAREFPRASPVPSVVDPVQRVMQEIVPASPRHDGGAPRSCWAGGLRPVPVPRAVPALGGYVTSFRSQQSGCAGAALSWLLVRAPASPFSGVVGGWGPVLCKLVRPQPAGCVGLSPCVSEDEPQQVDS